MCTKTERAACQNIFLAKSANSFLKATFKIYLNQQLFFMYHEIVGAGSPSASQQNVTLPPAMRTASLGSWVMRGVSKNKQNKLKLLQVVKIQDTAKS